MAAPMLQQIVTCRCNDPLQMWSHVPAHASRKWWPALILRQRSFRAFSLPSRGRLGCPASAELHLYCWGHDEYAALGDGTTHNATRLPYPAGWHRNNSWCEVRAIDPRGLMIGQCQGNDYGIWELIAWRPLGEPSDPPPPPPAGDLEASFEYDCGNNDTCQFRCTSGAVDSRIWTFATGEPEESPEPAPDVRFTGAGDHLVTLKVSEAAGGDATAEATVKCSSHPRQGVRCR
jgi:hypothetical protein